MEIKERFSGFINPSLGAVRELNVTDSPVHAGTTEVDHTGGHVWMSAIAPNDY
jgi:hypothetical protein